MRTKITAWRVGIHAAFLGGLVALGCGGSQSKGEFPTRADLIDLTAAPPPTKIKVGNGVDVGAWQLTGPLPEAIDDVVEDGSTPWGRAALDAAAARPGVVLATRAMGCAARESASFLVAQGALPGRAVSRFIAGRCGVPTSYLRAGSVTLPGIPPGKSDAEVWAAMQGDVAKIAQSMGPGLSFLGVGFARSGDHAGAVLVTAERHARLERAPLVQAEGSVVLRGELLRPAAHIPQQHFHRPLAYRVTAACAELGIGRTKFYELLRDGQLRRIKLGKITLIDGHSLRSLLGGEVQTSE